MSSENQPTIPNLDKVGNLIIYLADEIEKKHHLPLFLTKLLKLLYIIDETSVKETGAPVTGLEYRVWKMGPVTYDVYVDLMKNKSEQLGFFAEAKKSDSASDRDWALIKSVNKFDDSDFSDYEMDLVDKIITDYGADADVDLIERLHQEGTLWRKIVDEKHLDELFRNKPTSRFTINLAELIADDKQKLDAFNTAKDSLKL